MQAPCSSLAAQTAARQDREEQEHFENVCESFRQYATFGEFVERLIVVLFTLLLVRTKLNLQQPFFWKI